MLTPAKLAVRPGEAPRAPAAQGWLGTAPGLSWGNPARVVGGSGGRGVGRAARDALPACGFRLKGPGPGSQQQQNGCAGGGASAPVPALLPPATCRRPAAPGPRRPPRRLPAPAPALPRGAADPGRALRPTPPAAPAPPRETRWPRPRRAAGRERSRRRTPGPTVRPAALPGRGGRRWRALRPSQSGVRRSLAEPGPGGERCTRGRAPRPRRRHRPPSLVPAMAFASPGALVTDLDPEY